MKSSHKTTSKKHLLGIPHQEKSTNRWQEKSGYLSDVELEAIIDKKIKKLKSSSLDLSNLNINDAQLNLVIKKIKLLRITEINLENNAISIDSCNELIKLAEENRCLKTIKVNFSLADNVDNEDLVNRLFQALQTDREYYDDDEIITTNPMMVDELHGSLSEVGLDINYLKKSTINQVYDGASPLPNIQETKDFYPFKKTPNFLFGPNTVVFSQLPHRQDDPLFVLNDASSYLWAYKWQRQQRMLISSNLVGQIKRFEQLLESLCNVQSYDLRSSLHSPQEVQDLIKDKVLPQIDLLRKENVGNNWLNNVMVFFGFGHYSLSFNGILDIVETNLKRVAEMDLSQCNAYAETVEEINFNN